MNAPHQRYAARDDVLFQEIHGEIVLLDMRSKTCFGLNEVGARIWGLLTKGLDVSAVVGHLLDEFEVGQQQLEQDVTRLVDELRARDLIGPVDT